MAHTPAPWGVTKLPIILPDGKPIGDEEGFMITHPGSEERLRSILAKKPVTSIRIAIVESSHYMPMAVAEANARLIASAPELLAALEAVTAHDKYGRFGKPDFDAAIRQCMDAIAKAKGTS